MTEVFLRRAYLAAVWLWLLFCLIVPTWMGKIHHYDENSEQWHVGGAFGITGSGNPFTAAAPLWHPPRSSGGLPSNVRWPLAPIVATHNVEIQIAATFWRFTNGLFLLGLAAMAARLTIRPRSSDRVLLVASAVTIAILTANVVLYGVGAASMGFALVAPVVVGVLSFGIVAGIFIGGFLLRPGIDKPSPDKQNVDSTPRQTDALGDDGHRIKAKPPTLSAMRALKWWWRPPAYLVLQLFIWILIMAQSWPVGRDVFGPYPCEPESVVLAYWLQFILCPFLGNRFRFFALSQVAVIVGIYTVPDWPQGGNVFLPIIRVPSNVWPLFWMQFFATLILVWRGPRIMKQVTLILSRKVEGET